MIGGAILSVLLVIGVFVVFRAHEKYHDDNDWIDWGW